MKTKKIFPVLLIAIAFFTASCVDNKISSEVEAIRGQQVEWMKAKTATETALVAMKTADADYRKAQTDAVTKQTAFDEATRSWNLKDRELSYNLAKAQNDALIAKAQNDVAIAQASLKYQLAKAAIDIANLNSNQATTDYINYQNQAALLASDYQNRLSLQGQIDNAKADLASSLTNLDDQINSIQSNIDALKTTLVTKNATLALLNSGSSSSDIVASLTNSNTILQLRKDSLSSASNNYYTAYNTANNNVHTLQSTIITYNSYLVKLSDLNISASDKLYYETQRDNLKTAYDDAVAKYPQYAQAAITASANYTALGTKINDLSRTISDNSIIINQINIYGLTYAINQVKSNIAGTTQTIDSYTSNINNYKDSKSIANAQIASLTKQLDDLNTKITAEESQVAYFKGLVDKDLAA